MKKYLYFALAVLYACSPALAQDDYPTETDLYVFWQPGRLSEKRFAVGIK